MFLGLPLGERGRFIADLGVDARNDGLLFTVGANNSFNITAATARDDGSAWDIRVVNNTNGVGVAGDFSSVYLRSAPDRLIGGTFDAVAGQAAQTYGTPTAALPAPGLPQSPDARRD